MVSKYAKNKYYRPGERQHGEAMAALRDLKIGEAKWDAYQDLLKTCRPFHPLPGVYRNLRGDFLRIVHTGDDTRREEFPAFEQELKSGHLWMPVYPSGVPWTMFDEKSEYGSNEFRYVLVEPIDIGFNQVAMNGVVLFQRRQIRIAVNAGVKNFWETIVTDQFDPSQGYFSVSPNGDLQEYPAWSFLSSRTPAPDSAVGLPVTPPQQLDTAGEGFPSLCPPYLSKDVASSFGGDVPDPSLGGGFQQLVDYNKSPDTPT